jgi:hypothetical protein
MGGVPFSTTFTKNLSPVLINPSTGMSIATTEARGDFGALSVVISNSRLRLNETSLEDALQTELPRAIALPLRHGRKARSKGS